MPPSSPCRCEALRRVLGANAPPLCGACTRKAVLDATVDSGWTCVKASHRLPYEDCGVPTQSFGYLGDDRLWVPSWAASVVATMLGEGADGAYCGPTLKEAAANEAFRTALDAVLRLVADLPREVARTRLNAFAASQGLAPLPPVSR